MTDQPPQTFSPINTMWKRIQTQKKKAQEEKKIVTITLTKDQYKVISDELTK